PEWNSHGIVQLENPLVAEMRKQPLPAGLLPETYASTPGLEVAAIPTTPNASVVGAVPCLRSPIPNEPPLPAEVLPVMFAQSVVFSPAVLLPESTRIPGRTPPSGAATLLLVIETLNVPLQSVALARMPLPWVF